MALRLAALCCALIAIALPARAHIVADPATGTGGAWFRTALRVGHGCNRTDTTAIAVTIPQDILIIRPQQKPGWEISIATRKLGKPVQGPHGPITEVTKSITWRGHLLDAYFDEFGLSMKLPDRGGTLILPVLQQCGSKSRNWAEAPSPDHNPGSSPAPVIILKPAADHGTEPHPH